jgi:DNA repair exonuclease SbcCD nuclease subunit
MFLFIGDPHIKLDNLDDIDLFYSKLELVIKQRKPDYIIIGGDLMHYHERLYTSPLNRAFNFVRDLSTHAKTYVLVGNHDMINNQQFLTDNHWMNAMKKWGDNVIVVDTVCSIQNNDKFALLCPYVPPGMFRTALETSTETTWQESSIIFAHQEFRGCKMGAIISESGDVWDDTLPLVISGHIHEKQRIGKKIYYSGSALQHSFGESEENIIVFVDWNGNIEEINLGLPRKKIVNVDVKNIDKIKLSKDDKLRVNVKATTEEIKTLKQTQEYKELIESGVKVHFHLKTVEKDKSKEQTSDVDQFDAVLLTMLKDEKNKYIMNDLSFIKS